VAPLSSPLPLAISTPLGQLEIDGWSILWSIVVVVITVLAATYASRAAVRLGRRVSGFQVDFVERTARVLRYTIYLLGAGIVLSILGAPIKPVLIALLLLIGALILVGRGIADNFGAGLVVQFRHSLRVGDLIQTGGFRGEVVELNSRAVVIETADGATVHVPNTQLVDDPMVNLSTRGLARSTVEVRIRPDDAGVRPDAAETAELLTGALGAVSGVRETPAPSAVLVGAAADELVFHLQLWHDPTAGAQACSGSTLAVDRALGSRHLIGRVSWPPGPVGPPPAAK
jgi:small-conductance mechanosensitive channel